MLVYVYAYVRLKLNGAILCSSEPSSFFYLAFDTCRVLQMTLLNGRSAVSSKPSERRIAVTMPVWHPSFDDNTNKSRQQRTTGAATAYYSNNYYLLLQQQLARLSADGKQGAQAQRLLLRPSTSLRDQAGMTAHTLCQQTQAPVRLRLQYSVAAVGFLHDSRNHARHA